MFRATFLLRLGVLCALLVSGCGLPSVLGEPKFQADGLVGADVWSFTDITMRPSLQQALRSKEVMDLFSDRLADAGADLHNLPTGSGRTLDFEKELLPRFDGEVAIAFSGPVDNPQFIVLAHTDDVDATLRLLADKAQPQLTRDARGVTRYEAGSGPSGLVGYKNWLLYSDSPTLRDQTLDRIDGKSGPSLATDGRYRGVVGRLKGDRLGFGYLDIAPLIDLAREQDARLQDELAAGGRVSYAFGLEPGPEPGVHVFGTSVEYAPDAPPAIPMAGQGDTLQTMDRLPKASMLAFGGPDLGIYVDSLQDLVSDDEQAAALDALVGQFAGPYAVGVTTPTLRRVPFEDESFNASMLLGGVFFLAHLAPNADTDLISAVADEIAASTGDDGAAEWQTKVVFDNDWVAINAVPLSASVDDVPEDLLASDRVYQWVRSGMIQNGTNLFFNLDAFETALFGQSLSSEELAAIRPFRALGFSSQVEPQGDGHAHMTVFIVPE